MSPPTDSILHGSLFNSGFPDFHILVLIVLRTIRVRAMIYIDIFTSFAWSLLLAWLACVATQRHVSSAWGTIFTVCVTLNGFATVLLLWLTHKYSNMAAMFTLFVAGLHLTSALVAFTVCAVGLGNEHMPEDDSYFASTLGFLSILVRVVLLFSCMSWIRSSRLYFSTGSMQKKAALDDALVGYGRKRRSSIGRSSIGTKGEFRTKLEVPGLVDAISQMVSG